MAKFQGNGLNQITGYNDTMAGINLSNIASSITLGSTASSASWTSTPYQTVSLDSFDLNDFNRHPDVKKYEVYESPEDVVVLSATWKRMRDENRYGIVKKLMDHQLFKEITPADREKAVEIRDYYSKKIMMWNLKGINMTNYRKDLSKLIHSDGTMLREDMLGLAYHLPAFYQYDLDFEEIRLTTNHKGVKGPVKGILDLEPIKRLCRKTRSNASVDYWFKEKQTGQPVRIGLSMKNPLQHIWDFTFENAKVLPVEGMFIHKNIDEFEYLLATEKWELKL